MIHLLKFAGLAAGALIILGLFVALFYGAVAVFVHAVGWPLAVFVVLVVVCAWLMVRSWRQGVSHERSRP